MGKSFIKLVAGIAMIFTFRIDKTKRHLHNRKTEYFKALRKNDHWSAADHVSATRHNKWDHLEILASGKSDYHCKIKRNIVYAKS